MTNHSSSAASTVPADKKHNQLAQPFWPSDARSNARMVSPAGLAASDNASYLDSRLTGDIVGLNDADAAAFANAIFWEQPPESESAELLTTEEQASGSGKYEASSYTQPADSAQEQLGRERFAAEDAGYDYNFGCCGTGDIPLEYYTAMPENLEGFVPEAEFFDMPDYDESEAPVSAKAEDAEDYFLIDPEYDTAVAKAAHHSRCPAPEPEPESEDSSPEVKGTATVASQRQKIAPPTDR